jgi:hypothetical protein
MTQIFMSYRSTDSAKVDTIVSRLRSMNYKVWQDKDSITVGQDWWLSIAQGIKDSDVFMFGLSSAYLDSKVCLAELDYAAKLGMPLIPVVLEGEFTYNIKTGKNDIAFWGKLPQVLNDNRTQFAFYTGAAFFPEVQKAIDLALQTPPMRFDLKLPPDPRDNADGTNTPTMQFIKASEAADRSDYVTAERMFRMLMGSENEYKQEAYAWLNILHKYEELRELVVSKYTVSKFWQGWEGYKNLFAVGKPIFDPMRLHHKMQNIENDAPAPIPQQPIGTPPAASGPAAVPAAPLTQGEFMVAVALQLPDLEKRLKQQAPMLMNTYELIKGRLDLAFGVERAMIANQRQYDMGGFLLAQFDANQSHQRKNLREHLCEIDRRLEPLRTQKLIDLPHLDGC